MPAKHPSSPIRPVSSAHLPVWLALFVVVALTAMVALGRSTPRPAARQPKRPPAHVVTIRKRAGPPVVATDALDPHGRPVTVACNTCHTTKPPNPELRLGQKLALFHQKVTGKHGDLACASCHNPGDGYSSLRLANGRAVPFSEVMQLCAQCHGPQYRDYLRGAHGGMTGYWDLTRGPRVRNNCVDCHAPHAPRYPIVRPARGPGDVPADGSAGRAGHD
ncbi:MAG: hypothetical protein U0840_25380 [Gemmataceae bacterium]